MRLKGERYNSQPSQNMYKSGVGVPTTPSKGYPKILDTATTMQKSQKQADGSSNNLAESDDN